ncbi:hypothetical protein BGZ61DRAFT_85959 [Ilyonectria robusta]|uniref:uncharacterized protein n=1 Tax=Ilyonectria robusta TaxID=1079257 RepID=UPI001E8E2907|nr:uncharacterized protein BGZ61DRAFT_85959 [Ilyonectria robusta]KAH8735789.1 hypothetical protein BGZ61DRAFT_85959 [Ilyonectria robusta]
MGPGRDKASSKTWELPTNTTTNTQQQHQQQSRFLSAPTRDEQQGCAVSCELCGLGTNHVDLAASRCHLACLGMTAKPETGFGRRCRRACKAVLHTTFPTMSTCLSHLGVVYMQEYLEDGHGSPHPSNVCPKDSSSDASPASDKQNAMARWRFDSCSVSQLKNTQNPKRPPLFPCSPVPA